MVHSQCSMLYMMLAKYDEKVKKAELCAVAEGLCHMDTGLVFHRVSGAPELVLCCFTTGL